MTTQRDLAIERVYSLTMWLQNAGLIDDRTERMLREDLEREVSYYIEDKPLTEKQRQEYDR